MSGIMCAEAYQTDKYTTLYWDWFKWYEDYPEVRFIENFKNDVSHIFRRLGEDNDDYEYTDSDNEECWDMSDCVSVIRKLDIDNAGERIKIDGGN